MDTTRTEILWGISMRDNERRKAAENIKVLGWTYWRGYWRNIFRTKQGAREVKFASPIDVCAWLRGGALRGGKGGGA